MSRLDEALRHLGSGRPAVLIDEDFETARNLVIGADASPEILQELALQGADGEAVLWLGPGEPATFTPTGGPAFMFDGASTSPRRTAPNGVLERARSAEAAIDALRLAGGRAAVYILPLPMAAGDPGEAAASTLPVFSIQDVIEARLSRETIVEFVAAARLPSIYAEAPLEVRAFRNLIDGSEHLAMVHGPLGRQPLVRLHSECLTGDALGSLRCDCGDQLRESLRMIAAHPEGGVVVYLRGQEGRGIGLVNKIRAYALQDDGRDTVEANLDLGFPVDLRGYGVAVQILTLLGVTRLTLLSNNPAKARALDRYGIEVAERLSLRMVPNAHNAGYIETKREKMGHDFDAPVDGTLALPV